MNKKSTRYYSSRQEKQIAKATGSKLQPNSGATLFRKGDVINEDWLFEAKTCMKEQESFSIKKEWLSKLKQEAFAMNREFYALVFNFGENQENYFVINEKIFKQILSLLEELENDEWRANNWKYKFSL